MSAVRFELADSQGWICFYCEAVMTRASVTKDHLIPRCRGGANDKSNLVAACVACNQAKSDLDAMLFITLRLDGLERGWWPAGRPVSTPVWRRKLREHLNPSRPEYLNLSLSDEQFAA